MDLVFLSPPWGMRALLALFVFPMFLLLLIWSITFFPFINLQMTILVLSNLTLLVLLIRLPGVHFSDVTARGPFTPSGFHLPLPRLQLLLRRLLSSPPPLPLPGTAALVTQAATFWLSSAVVQICLVLELLMSIFVMRANRLFDLVQCDMWTSPVLSVSGYKYYLVVVDDFSHYSWTFPLRFKSETLSTLSHFFAWVSTQFGLTIKAVQCDNGREFDNNAYRSFFLTRGVQLRMSCPYTSAQNGKAKHMIRTTNDVMRTLLFSSRSLLAESLHTATYLINCLPSNASPAPTPHHALFGTPPRYDHLRVFGCACYPNTSATAPHKLAPRSTRCVFLGYSPDHKGYRCFDLMSRQVLISRHVVFNESVFPFSSTTTLASDLELESLFPTDPVVQPSLSQRSAGPPPVCLPDVLAPFLVFPVAPCAAPKSPAAPHAAPKSPAESPATPRTAPESPVAPRAAPNPRCPPLGRVRPPCLPYAMRSPCVSTSGARWSPLL
ncbi:LOW QUALITY PROTEIN: hypothetical protein U9M48_039556 [Paspalum notatum var. saurae]|uniref:Integrase catalytic domain-containing protein n=1 Tax=Paspalum notatum var. saurae TaxID=547442 RepID=A0AAQ3UJ63_PASNO